MWKNKVTIRSAAEILGISEQTLRNWDRLGKLRPVRDKKTGYRLYDISALERFATREKIRRPNRKLKLVP